MSNITEAVPPPGGSTEIDYSKLIGYYMYHIALAPNVTFLSIFAICLLIFIGVYAFTRRALTYSISLSLGVLSEILGYGGRIISWKDQYSDDGFLMQITTLTIGPAFMMAGVYFCLRRIVMVYGVQNSKLPALYYPKIFIPCDAVSLCLQAAGGGIASVASQQKKSTKLGDDLMIAGLSFQVVTSLVFIGLATDFALRCLRRYRHMGPSALDDDPMYVDIRRSRMFKACLAALGLATLFILIRSVFRVVELSGGWTGPMMEEQTLFYCMEGAMISVSAVLLAVFHPSLCFGQVLDGPKEPAKRHRGGFPNSMRLASLALDSTCMHCGAKLEVTNPQKANQGGFTREMNSSRETVQSVFPFSTGAPNRTNRMRGGASKTWV